MSIAPGTPPHMRSRMNVVKKRDLSDLKDSAGCKLLLADGLARLVISIVLLRVCVSVSGSNATSLLQSFHC